MSLRRYSSTDRLLMRLSAPRAATVPSSPAVASAPASPAAGAPETRSLDGVARREAANLMRVNHAGEVAAQGLYHGQALTARDPKTREHLLEAAQEEAAHLAWCEQRLSELGDGPSRLRPLWYGASYAMGAIAGLFGDRWSLGFVAETERQVGEHLDEHLQRLPADDARSRAVLSAMRSDEARHGREAEHRGAAPLPGPVRRLMRRVAGVMKFGAYRV